MKFIAYGHAASTWESFSHSELLWYSAMVDGGGSRQGEQQGQETDVAQALDDGDAGLSKEWGV